MTATPLTLPTGGSVATLSRRGARDWNADHVTVRTASEPDRVTAIAIADGVGDNALAAWCAHVAAETTAAAAAHTSMAGAGIHAARAAVRRFYALDPEPQTATATIVAAVIVELGIGVAWAGDTVVFALDTDGVLHTLTEPNPMPTNVTEGRIRQRYVWTSDPGGQEVDLRLDVRRLLVTSSGLTHRLTCEQITQILTAADTPQSACERLADAAENAHADDNLTVAVVDLTPVSRQFH
jgi:serine/threonine protein phosphatase PrpC